MIKHKNRPFEDYCFKFTNYLESHGQQIFKRSAAEQAQQLVDKKNKNKDCNYRNKTMSTNIMEGDIPIAMKFRNYINGKKKVTIGPSGIHRNGLFATEQ